MFKTMIQNRKMNEPFLIMMVGLPGSGKSTFAKSIYSEIDNKRINPVIHSSDNLREELYGNAAIQGDNNKLFAELHKRIRNDLSQGKDVVYDATNINKKNRIAFLKEISKVRCHPICFVMATEYNACLFNNQKRERKVPEDVIHKMFINFQPPHESEGFENIHYCFTYLNKKNELVEKAPNNNYALSNYFKIANNFNQENSHHTFTLGRHCTETGKYIQNKRPNDFWLLMTALLHDVGKLDTKSKFNCRGIEDGEYHYFNHNCAGSYSSMFYFDNIEKVWNKPCPMSDVTNYIYYHMHPYLAWKQSNKAKERDKKLLGDKMFNDIMLLHEADVAAH